MPQRNPIQVQQRDIQKQIHTTTGTAADLATPPLDMGAQQAAGAIDSATGTWTAFGRCDETPVDVGDGFRAA